MSVYYNFTQFNNTDSPVFCNQTDVRLVPLVQRADEYQLQIVKLVIPSQSIETFIIENTLDYRIQYSMPNVSIGPSYSWLTTTASNSMPLSSTQKIYSVSEWLELWNRTSLATYRDLLYNLYNISMSNYYSLAKSENINLFGDDTVYDSTYLMDILPTGSKVAYIKVSGTLTSTLASSYELQLIHPNGTSKNVIFSNKQIVPGGSPSFVFEDASLRNQSSLTVLSGSMQPLEGFVVHNTINDDCKGTWKLRFINKNLDITQPFQFSYNITLSLYTCPKANLNPSTLQGFVEYNFPRLAPTLSLDGESLVLSYDQASTRSGFGLGISPKMYQLLGFKGSKGINGYYLLDIPQSANMEDNTLSIITYKQAAPTAYKLQDISEIVIESSTLPVLGEANNIDGAPIIQSINTSSTDINPSLFEYYSSDIESRTYDLVSDQPINTINVSVYVRYSQDNSLRPAMLSPYSRFAMLLKFKKKGGI